MKRFYSVVIFAGEHSQSALLLLLRLFWGYLFFISGVGKFMHLANVTEFFTSLGIPFPEFNAYAASTIELVGGLLLFIGLGSRLVAIPLALLTLTAMLTDNIEIVRNVLNAPQELVSVLPMTFFLVSLVIFAFGPGKVSLDAWIKRSV